MHVECAERWRFEKYYKLLSNVYEGNGQFVSPETRTVARGR